MKKIDDTTGRKSDPLACCRDSARPLDQASKGPACAERVLQSEIHA